jgi:DNA-directed RNA polymerase specialized sigma24 family protein
LQNSKKTKGKSQNRPESDEVPDQLTYEDIEPIVEYLVKVKARDNTFDCWDSDDIAQEIRIICLHALVGYEPSRAKNYKQVVNYFGRCVDNRLKNLKRDRYIRFSPPLSKDVIKEVEENPDAYPEERRKLEKHKEGLEIQKKIKHPANIEVVGDANSFTPTNLEDEIIARDMQRHLIENIDEALRPSLISLLKGEKRKVNIRIRKRIQASVRTILDE